MHTWSTGTSPPCWTLPGLSPTHREGVPSLTSWLARRAWIRAQTPVISAMCAENINRPFHQHPALSPCCGQMPGKLLAEMCGLILPRFTACGQEQHYFFAGSIALRVCRGRGTAKRRCHFMAALLQGGCEHLWGTQQIVHGHGPPTAVSSWLRKVFQSNTKCPPFRTSRAQIGSGIIGMLPCVG